MSFARLQTSKSRLRIRWQKAPNLDRRDLVTFEQVFGNIAERGGDKPVLFHRTSDQRDERVKTLLGQALKSERFSLASQWFHCVKVGDEVLGEHHPLHELFDGRNPPALVLVTPDAKKRVAFLGTSSQKVKWTPIASVLKASYKKNATTAVKGLEKLLCEFDRLDGKKNELNAQLARAEKKRNKGKVASIRKKLAAEAKDRSKALEAEAKLRDISLRKSGDD